LFYRFHVESARFFNNDVPKTFDGDWKKYLKPQLALPEITVKAERG
jgi:hypothetical protein